MQTIIFITLQHLMEILSSIPRRFQQITLESTVEKPHTKKGRTTGIPFGDLFPKGMFQTRKQYVSIYANYQNAVNNQREREGKEKDFEAFGLPFGNWVEGADMLLIEHKDTNYLRYYESLNGNFVYSEYVWHDEDGDVYDEEQVETYKKEYGKTYSSSTRQGVEKTISPRSIKLSGITRIIADKKVIVRKGQTTEKDRESFISWHNNKVEEIGAN